MNNAEAFLLFTKEILSEKEGIFWSELGENGQENWIFGTGKKLKADFENGPFPFFSIIDFLGKEKKYYYFKDWKSKQTTIASSVNVKEEAVFPQKLQNKLSKFFKNGRSNETQTSFSKKINFIQKAQKAGDIWVLNLAHEISGKMTSASSQEINQALLWKFYEFLKLKRVHAGGVILTTEQKMCSMSPEVFLRQNKQNIKTFPIKGTGSKSNLEHSQKEISELCMITDLLRNDLAQIGEKIKVPRNRFLTDEGFFFHARAEISAQLLTNILQESSFQKLLPAGSISGAPKKRVIEEILKQESFNRGFYTGTFGVKFSKEESIFNILIRTLFVTGDKWKFPVGSGITTDSIPKAEWEETWEKAKIL